MRKPIPIIDLFAGPGGLGEGFSSIYDSQNKRIFEIKLSIEKDIYAHKTLELRSFYRKFPKEQVPNEYYNFLRETNFKKQLIQRKELFIKYKHEGDEAQKEAWLAELGKTDKNEINKRIIEVIQNNNNWVLIGGPPCQAYSLIGRSRVNGINEDDHRVYLYEEYLRILAYHKPAVFVMENVKGLLSSKINGENIFSKMFQDLKNPSGIFPDTNCPRYKIFSLVKEPIEIDNNGNPIYKKDRDFLIEAEKYGIPQKRHRVILLGIREDIKLKSPIIIKTENKVTLKEVIDDLPKIRSTISRKRNGEYIINGKLKTLYQPIDDNLSVWENQIQLFSEELKVPEYKSLDFKYDSGKNFIKYSGYKQGKYMNWFFDEKLDGFCNHKSRSHLLEDLKRYMFSINFLNEFCYSPKLTDYPENILPAHKNARSNKFVDRFKVQNPNEPSSTITSHISKDGHYFIHYDIKQCRSFTVREAARIQTFPDNYYFCGPRTQQFHQVGNAVPPLLAKQIAEVVYKILTLNI